MPTTKEIISAPEGTFPAEDWPLDVQRTDESGEVDLSLVEYMLSLTPAQRLRQAEDFAQFILGCRQRGVIHGPVHTDSQAS